MPREPMQRRVSPPLTVLAVASLGVFMAFVDATIVNIAFPDIGESFPESDISSLSWILSAYNIVFAAFLVSAGRIADLIGRRRVFLAGIIIFTVASVLCGLAPSVNTLVGFRIIQALGAALIVPSSLALVLNAFPPDRRAHAVALLSAIGALAAGIGPTLGGFLVSAESWRLVFMVNLPIGVAAYFLSKRHLIESREPGRRQMPDLAGALVFAVAIAALVLGVVQGDEWGWTSPVILGSYAVAIVLGALFVRRCARHRSPIIDLDLFRSRTFSVSNLATVVAAAGFFGYTLVNVLFLTGVWQYSILEAGLAITPGPFVAASVAGPTSRLATRFGHRPVLVAGGLIWAAAVYWFVARVGVTPDFLGEWLPGMILLGIGAGSLFPNLSGAAVASAPGQAFGTATGINSVARQVGAALGVAVAVAIIGAPTPLEAAQAFDNAWTFSALSIGLAAILCLGVSRLRSEDDVTLSPSLGVSTRLMLGKDRPAAAAEPALPATRAATEPEPAESPMFRPESAADFLGRAPMFAPLSEADRATIAQKSTEIRIKAGEVLFREGDAADTLYVVRAGRLEVFNEDGGAVIRTLGRGAALGELALLTAMPRSASVRAARDSDLLTIGRDEFERVLAEDPEVSLSLTRTLGSQLRGSVGAVPQSRDTPVTIALVALDDRVEIGDLAGPLRNALGRWGKVALLDGTEVGPPSAGAGAVVTYAPILDAAEKANDQVVLVGRSAFSDDPWTRYCLQQADRIIAFASGGAPGPEHSGHPELKGCDLAAWDVAQGSGGLSGWAEALDPGETHSVRSGTLDADAARMARRLSGNSVGIVLSGGGARAFAHIGVLEELMAAGIVIDRVGGVSMGAFVGGMFSMGMDPQEIDARCFEEWVRRRPLGDYTIPRKSLIRGERAKGMLERTFGTVSIEELDRSLFTGSTELRSGELVVNRWGLLWEAVGTSFSLPVLAPAHVRGRQLLIDGSLVDNLPVETMSSTGEGPVIAVDIKANLKRPPNTQLADAATGGPDGGSMDDDREIRVPGITETLARVLLLGSSNTSKAARQHADWIIEPQSDGVGLLEFHQLDSARDSGRKAAREALEDVPSRILG